MEKDNETVTEENYTEGQLADFAAGFRGIYYCPTCKTVREYEPPGGDPDPDYYEKSSEAQKAGYKKAASTRWRNRRMRGNAAEEIVDKELSDKGISFARTMIFDETKKKHVLNLNDIKKLIKEHKRKNEVMMILNELRVGLPDRICLDKNKIYFIEIKSNKSEVKPEQKLAIDQLRNYGFKVIVRRIKVDLSQTI